MPLGKDRSHTQLHTTARYELPARDMVVTSVINVGDSVEQDLDHRSLIDCWRNGLRPELSHG